VVVTNAKYPLSKNVKNNLIGALIEENAKIGANVTTLPGVKIGKNALVGSGSLVNKDVGEGEVVVGNPIRKIKEVKDIKEYNE
jgi:acetyltransferase-like isoleucine patch superfamily enzyme